MPKRKKPSKPSKRPAPEGKKPGRPKGATNFTPTTEQRNMVEQLAGMVIPDADICRLVLHEGEPIGESTLKNHFRKELSQGRAKLRVRHGMALFKAIEDGNVTAMIWWDKTRNGIREKIGLDLPAQSTAAAEVSMSPGDGKSTLEIGRRIAFTLSMAASQASKPAPAPQAPAPVPQPSQKRREPA